MRDGEGRAGADIIRQLGQCRRDVRQRLIRIGQVLGELHQVVALAQGLEQFRIARLLFADGAPRHADRLLSCTIWASYLSHR
jgi:hypothetical protein